MPGGISVKHLTFAVIVVMVLTCAAMAQTAYNGDNPWRSSRTGEIVNPQPDAVPGWAAPTWERGVRDGNIHGRDMGWSTTDPAPTAFATRAEAWAFAVAAAEQIWRDNSWVMAVLIGLALGLIAGLIALVLMRRELNALRSQPPTVPTINLTLSLPNGLWSGPLVSGVSATASPTVSAEGGTTSSAAEGSMGGTANVADNASNAGTRTTTTETKNDYSVNTDGAGADANGNPV